MRKSIIFSLIKVILLVGITFPLMNVSSLGADSSEAKTAEEAKKKETLLYRSGLTTEPQQMMESWLLARIDEAQVKWNTRFEGLKTPADLQAYQKERVDYFWKQLGSLWEKTPLNAQVTGTMTGQGYRVEKILLESVPHFYMTGTMFLPMEEKFKAPWPGVLVVCGHSTNGKGSDFYQRGCILAATNGLATFIIDPIDQGDRFQHLKSDGTPYATTVPAHNLVGGGSILVGRNTATFEIWDMIRAIDYLQSRGDILADKIGVMGNSGGGTQTAYIMALDPRVKAAAPACFICNMFDTLPRVNGPQDAEQNIFGQLAFGMDHADYAIMRAPQPTVLCTATNDMFNIDDAWKSFRFAKRAYGLLGLGERMSLIETNTGHGWYPHLREGGVRWMLRWLAGRDEAVVDDPTLSILTDTEISSVPKPGVLGIPNAKTTYDLNRELAIELTAKRAERWKNITSEEAAALVRQVAGIRTLAELPQPIIHRVEGTTDEFVLETDQGIYLPCLSNIVEDAKDITLLIGDQGHNCSQSQTVLAGKSGGVFSVALRGWGESQARGRNYYAYDQFGTDGSDYYLAYLLGRSYIGMRTDDLLVVTKQLREKYPQAKIHLVANGYARTIALHAAVVEPKLFDSVTIEKEETLATWNSLIEKAPCYIQLTDVIHGVLNHYDLDDLLAKVLLKSDNFKSL